MTIKSRDFSTNEKKKIETICGYGYRNLFTNQIKN